jgi:hypothetical protein
MDVVEHLKMWDQFIESKTTLNPSVSRDAENLFARLSNTKNSSKGGAIDTDPPESFIVDIIQQPWDRRCHHHSTDHGKRISDPL